MYPVPVTRGNKIAVLSFCVLFITSFAQAQCIASGPNSPGNSSSVSFSGSDYAFDDPLNILSDDNSISEASSVFSLFSKQTEYLQAKNFGFAIPAGATICGIEVNVVKSAANVLLNLASVRDYNVRIIKNNLLPGTDLADGAQWSSSKTYSSYGSVNELWGTSWTPSDINSSNFGISISAEIITTASLFPAARIDHISITVYYMDPSVLSAQAIQFKVVNGNNRSAVLSWKANTIAEKETVTIERSNNGKTWETLSGAVQKNDITSLLIFNDVHPLPGKSWYRLKMISALGHVRYTTALPFEQKDHTSIKCYPNPFTSFIQVTGVQAGEQVLLTDVYGKRLYYSLTAVNNTLSVDVSHLQPGIYVISAGNRKMKIQKK